MPVGEPLLECTAGGEILAGVFGKRVDRGFEEELGESGGMRGVVSPKNTFKATALKKMDMNDGDDGGGGGASSGGGSGFREIPLQDLSTKAATRAPAADTICEIERVQGGDGAWEDGVEQPEGGAVGGGVVTRDDMTKMCWQKILEQTKGVLPVCFFLAGFQVRFFSLRSSGCCFWPRSGSRSRRHSAVEESKESNHMI